METEATFTDSDFKQFSELNPLAWFQLCNIRLTRIIGEMQIIKSNMEKHAIEQDAHISDLEQIIEDSKKELPETPA